MNFDSIEGLSEQELEELFNDMLNNNYYNSNCSSGISKQYGTLCRYYDTACFAGTGIVIGTYCVPYKCDWSVNSCTPCWSNRCTRN